MRLAAPSLPAIVMSVCLAAACASSKLPVPPAVSPRYSPAVVEARLAEADAMAARGCYLCLKEAAAAYSALVEVADTPAVIRKTLENDLMLAIREIELRLPDSGARERARRLEVRLKVRLKPDTTEVVKYDAYFAFLESLGKPLAIGSTYQEARQREAERKVMADGLEPAWPSSAMAAYFYVAAATSAGQVATLKPQVDAILNTYPQNLAVQYRFQAFQPTSSSETARDLLMQEPRFGEIHYLLGQRAVFGSALVIGHGELTAAYELLPDSHAIALAFGQLELTFGRYPQALQLFDGVLARGPDGPAELGRAVALSYLKRHKEAIAALGELLKDPSSSPGDKYYWRAWNWLALSESQLAYDDAKAAMNAMANAEVFKLGGIASYNLARIGEARGYFESSLKMNASECDSLRFLGLIDAAERSWQPAALRFTTAAACYRRAIEAMESELVKKQADTSGLYAGQISAIAADIAEAKGLLEASSHNAEVATRNAAPPPLPPSPPKPTGARRR